jgi:branched-chain amino acid transport system substrate-binding protein
MKRSKWLVFAGMLFAFTMVAAACGNSDNNNASSGGGSCTWVIGTTGALSGDYASIGVPIEQGVEAAVKQANDAGDVPCTLEIDKQDSQGSDTQSPAIARKFGQNSDLVAVVGPYFSGETLAAGPIYDQGGVPFITPSATDPSLAQQGWTHFFRAVGNDADQGPTAATYIQDSLKPSSVVVIDDNSQYGKTLAGIVSDSLKSSGGVTVTGPLHIDPAESDYSAVVTQAQAASPDVVYYGGYVPQAGPLLLQLNQAGFTGTFVSDDGAKDATFGGLAKDAAAQAQVTCPCADPTKLPGATDFVNAIKAQFNRAPGTFSADAFDATNIIIEGLKQQAAGTSGTDVRTALTTYIAGVSGYQGITKTYTFKSDGEVTIDPLKDIWIYKWDTGAKDFVSLGPAGSVGGQ